MKPMDSLVAGTLALACSISCFVSGCGGGGGGGGSGSTTTDATIDVLVTDAPVDDLLSFSARITSIRLRESGGGGESANLIAEPLDVEFLGLGSVHRWLASAQVPAGDYDAVALGFTPNAYAARDLSGGSVPVTALADELTLPLPASFTVGAGGDRRVLVDLDLASSLTGSVESALDFDPHGSATSDDGGSALALDDVRGRIVDFDALASDLTVDAFADGDGSTALGRIHVTVASAAVLVDANQETFPSDAAFFDALVSQSTLVEIDGALAGGVLTADTIEIDDSGVGGAGSTRVTIEGRIVSLVGGTSLQLAIREIEQGTSIAGPALANLGDPGAIAVGISPATPVFFPGHQPASPSQLAVGQIVEVRFDNFDGVPFTAARIEIELGRAALALVERVGERELVLALRDLPALPVALARSPEFSELAAGDELRLGGRILVLGDRATFDAKLVERASVRITGVLAARELGGDGVRELVLDVATPAGARFERLRLDADTRISAAARSRLERPNLGGALRLDAELVRALDGRSWRARRIALARD